MYSTGVGDRCLYLQLLPTGWYFFSG